MTVTGAGLVWARRTLGATARQLGLNAEGLFADIASVRVASHTASLGCGCEVQRVDRTWCILLGFDFGKNILDYRSRSVNG